MEKTYSEFMSLAKWDREILDMVQPMWCWIFIMGHFMISLLFFYGINNHRFNQWYTVFILMIFIKLFVTMPLWLLMVL